MRHFLALVFLFSWHLTCFSQTLTGTVREKGTGLPLPFANVFVNNTTIGSATDAEGRFRIIGEFSPDIELVASFVGYVTEVKAISFRKKGEVQVDFVLAFNESNLTEIVDLKKYFWHYLMIRTARKSKLKTLGCWNLRM
jgi:hypothetical protein